MWQTADRQSDSDFIRYKFSFYLSCQRCYLLTRHCCLVLERCFVGWSVTFLSYIERPLFWVISREGSEVKAARKKKEKELGLMRMKREEAPIFRSAFVSVGSCISFSVSLSISVSLFGKFLQFLHTWLCSVRTQRCSRPLACKFFSPSMLELPACSWGLGGGQLSKGGGRETPILLTLSFRIFFTVAEEEIIIIVSLRSLETERWPVMSSEVTLHSSPVSASAVNCHFT